MLTNDICTKRFTCSGKCDSACTLCNADLIAYLSKDSLKGVNVTSFVEHMRNTGIGPVGVCSICGQRYTFGGNNPSPVVTDVDARCCKRCRDEVVVPELFTRTDNMIGGLGSKQKKKHASRTWKLPPEIIVQFVRDVGRPVLISSKQSYEADRLRYDIIDAEYNAPFLTFKRVDSDDVVTIDEEKIHSMYFEGSDCQLRIKVYGEVDAWRLHSNYDETRNFDFRPSGDEPLKPYEVKAVLLKAAELEAYINKSLDYADASCDRVYVRFRAMRINGRYDFRYEISIGDNIMPHTRIMFISLAKYSSCLGMDIVKDITRRLIKDQLDAKLFRVFIE